MNLTGRIFNISHFAVHDGPGIRTTVFLKGCPLRCQWCCSPQGQRFACEHAVSGPKTFGYDIGVAELFDRISCDAHIWRRSGGGVTLSGGEVLSQPDFAVALMDRCHQYGVHTAVETCLYAQHETATRVLEKADFVQFDIKAVSSELHRTLTGAGNESILFNAAMLLRSNKNVLARFPLIPGITDSEENLRSIGNFLENERVGVSLEVLPYHKLGLIHYEELGRAYQLSSVNTPTSDEMERARNIFREYRINVF